MTAKKSTDQAPEELLRGVPFFAGLSKRSLRSLGRLCLPRRYAAGTLLIEEGDVGLGLFVVTSGRVEVFIGRKEESRVSLAVLEPGDIIGEMALIDDQPRSASALTLGEVTCLLITRDRFQTLVRRDPEVAWCIVPTLAERMRQLQQRILGEEGEARLQMGPAEFAHPVTPTAATVPGEQGRAGVGLGEAQEESHPPTSTAVRLLRAQYAASMAAVTGLSGSLELGGTFLRALAKQTGLGRSRRARDVVRRLPRGLAGALREALEEGERVPERMVASFRRHLKR